MTMRKSEQRLRERVKELEAELDEVKADRAEFRNYLVGKMKWLIQIHGKGEGVPRAWLIEDLAQFFQRVQRWYW
jgi:hypothetical protein